MKLAWATDIHLDHAKESARRKFCKSVNDQADALVAGAPPPTITHILLGGKLLGSSGRFPGLAEEAMLSLANKRPIYVCGGFGGAANELGTVLGIGEPWTAVPAFLLLDTHGQGAAVLEAAVKAWGWRFQLPHNRELPLTYEELLSFLRAHAVNGPRWPDNGLTPEENRALFRCSDADEIVRLVTNGLCRRGE